MNALTKAASDVLAERQRQIEAEGWTPEHDDAHGAGSMAFAAAAYAVHAHAGPRLSSPLWAWTGWSRDWWKPKGARRDLVRAAALLLAEIERLDRAAGTSGVQEGKPDAPRGVEQTEPFWCHEQSHDRPRCEAQCAECAEDGAPASDPDCFIGGAAGEATYAVAQVEAPSHMRSVPRALFIDLDSYLRHIESFGSDDQKRMAEAVRKTVEPHLAGVSEVCRRCGAIEANGESHGVPCIASGVALPREPQPVADVILVSGKVASCRERAGHGLPDGPHALYAAAGVKGLDRG